MMTANKPHAPFRFISSFFLGVCLFLAVTEARAQGSAPSLMGVTEIQVQHARFGNTAASDGCGLSNSIASGHILEKLKEVQLPAFSVMDAPALKMGVARIDLMPEVVTMQKQGLDCTSWVALMAQSRVSTRIPPIETPRNVTVTYWRGGLMISSPQVSHPRAVREALYKLSLEFAKQYRADQPPPLPDFKD